MTLNDFSNGFDTLLNSWASRDDFGTVSADIRLDEYEKSFYLTKSQEEYVLSLYNGKNIDNEAFEHTEELRRYLSFLVREAELSPIETSDGKPLGMESSSKFFTLPEDLWFITYEKAINAGETCDYKHSQGVYPVRQDEYQRLRKNPFRGANDRRALRLDLSEGIIEIVSKFGVTSYYVRYLRKLKPIVLTNLDEDVSIDGVNKATECELPEYLHQRILEMAVMMALRTKGMINNNENR